MSGALPIWRSMLFVPAHVEKFVAKAHTRGADACILDLEDSVPLERKVEARAAITAGARSIAEHGLGVLVRVNEESEGLDADLAAAVCPAVQAVVVPKVNDAAVIERVAGKLDALEAERGMTSGQTRIVAQIEDVRALPALDNIAAGSSRMLGMSLGPEDFSVSAGIATTTETLFMPNQMVAFACRRAGILPLGFPASIGEYGDLEAFRKAVKLAREMGFVGAFCIHPDQASILNEELSPSEEEVAWAEGLLEADEQARREGRGAFAYQGRMVDPPVISRAEEILRRHRAIDRRG